MISLLPFVMLLAAAPVKPATVRAHVVDEEIRVTTDGAEPVIGTRRTVFAPGRIRRESSLDGTVILLRSSESVPVALLDVRAGTWFGYEASTLAKADLGGGPLLEGLGIDESGEPVAPAEPFRATKTKERVGAWDAVLYTATAKGAGGMETAVWLAEKPSGLPNDTGLATMRAIYSRKGARLAPYFASLAKLPGFPVRWVFKMTYPNGVKSVATITVTRVHEEDVALTELEIPAGAERIPDPIGVVPGGK